MQYRILKENDVASLMMTATPNDVASLMFFGKHCIIARDTEQHHYAEHNIISASADAALKYNAFYDIINAKR